MNLDLVPESDYSVTVGGQTCTELDVNEAGEVITCLPPQSVSIVGLDNVPVTVSGQCDSVNGYVCCLWHLSWSVSNPVTYIRIFLCVFLKIHTCVHTCSMYLQPIPGVCGKDVRTYVRTYVHHAYLITF